MSGDPTVPGSLNASLPEVHFNVVWKIETFSSLSKKVGECLKSPDFSATGYLPGSFYLACYPQGDSQIHEGSISLYLYTEFPVAAKGAISMLSKSGQKKHTVNFGLSSSTPGNGWGYPTYITRSTLNYQNEDLLPNDALSICCEIIAYPVSAKNISQDLGKLLSNPQFSDITLVVEGKKLQAHKAILSSRSPTFSRMLNSEMKESSSGEILIEDISKEALQELLRYIYTDQVQNIDKLAHELYYVADKCQVDGLKQICSLFLSKTFSISYCIETLRISDRHCDEKLKHSTLDYITNNIETIVETEAWKKLVASNSSLVNDVLCLHVKKYVKTKE